MRLQSLCAAMIAAISACLCLATPAQAIVNGTEPGCADWRFDGVGLLCRSLNPLVPCLQNISGTCVLIDEQTVLVARHSIIDSPTEALPAAGARMFKVRFRRDSNGFAFNSYYAPLNNACHGQYTEVWIHEFYRSNTGGMDVLMGKLETPVRNIVPIQAETNSAAMPSAGSKVWVAGWGYSGSCFRTGTALTLKVAQGVLPTQASPDSCCLVLNPCTTPSTTGACYTCPAAPAGQSWILPNYLDSGSPVLVESPCMDSASGRRELRVIGIVSTTSTAWRTSMWNLNNTQPAIQTPQLCRHCASDFNDDGVVNADDLFAYLDAWFERACLSDVNQANSVNSDDLFIFLDAFFRGC